MRQILFFVFISFSFCTGQDKCSVRDSECQKNYFQNIATLYAATGLPDVGVPIIDPFKVDNVVMPILGLVNVTASGEAEGIGKCVVTKYESNLEEWWREAEILCKKIILRGHYKITSAPVVKETCKWCEIHGEGYGTMTFDDWYFKFRYPFKFVKRNGEVYLKPFFENAVYESKVKHVKVEANQIKVGIFDITKLATGFMNHNTQLMMGSDIGKFINDQSAVYYYSIYKIFFDRAPANTYLSDNDLSELAVDE